MPSLATQFELDRRRPGQSRITTPRNEEDTCEILSGTRWRRAAWASTHAAALRLCAGLTPDGQTLGTPIAVLVRNKDQRSNDYSEMSVRGTPPESARHCGVLTLSSAQVAYRPSHADATYDMKYGVRAIAVRWTALCTPVELR